MTTNENMRRPSARMWRLMAGALIALFVFGGLSYWQRARNDPDAVIDRLAADPSFGNAFTVFQREFPADYAAFRQQAKANFAADATPEVGYGRMMAFMRQWVDSKRPLILRADGEALAALIAEQNRMLRHLLATDVQECATFGMEGRMASPDMKDAGLRRLAADGMERTLLAIKSGERAGASPPEALTEADHRIFRAALDRRVSDASKLALLTSGALPSAKPETQCNLMIAMTEAIGDLPQPLRGKFARSILAG
ncbi:MAG: hypothetical protein ABW173_03930 [Sphingomonas sp.]